MTGTGKPPTVDEEAWFAACRLLTCAVCYRLDSATPMQEQHHILEGGRRVGHCASIPLCRYHHQQPGGPAAFHRQFKFTELDLLNDTIGRVMHLRRS